MRARVGEQPRVQPHQRQRAEPGERRGRGAARLERAAEREQVHVHEEHGLDVLQREVEVAEVARQDQRGSAEHEVRQPARCRPRREREGDIDGRHAREVAQNAEACSAQRGGARGRLVVELEQARDLEPRQQVHEREERGHREHARHRAPRKPDLACLPIHADTAPHGSGARFGSPGAGLEPGAAR
jgi:hypothetical protein